MQRRKKKKRARFSDKAADVFMDLCEDALREEAVMLMALQGNERLVEAASTMLREEMRDMDNSTPIWLANVRASYVVYAAATRLAGRDLSPRAIERLQFWLDTPADEILAMDPQEMHDRIGSLAGYKYLDSGRQNEPLKIQTKATKPPKEKRGLNIGEAICAAVESNPGISYEEALKIAKDINPDTKFSKASLSWYRNKLRKEGRIK